MKVALAFLIGLSAVISSTSVEQNVSSNTSLKKQNDILLLLRHINQPTTYKELTEISKTYNVKDNQDKYSNNQVVEQFLQYWEYGFLAKGNIFSIFYKEHMEEAVALFKLFYYAKDYDTFYKTAVWAREHLNEGLFLYSFLVAVVHRQDTKAIVLPPIYEIYPHYFYSTEVIQQAYIYKQKYGGQNLQEHSARDVYTIDSNYSGHYLNLDSEQSLSYYLEDIGISSFYFYFNIYYPYWMGGEEYGFKNVNRGEQYYYLHQQLLARFYLERLSNGFGEIPYLHWNTPVATSYQPSLKYPNGLEFPSRPKFANLHEYFYNYGQSWTTKGMYGYSYMLIQDFERRINDVIDRGYVYNKEGKKMDLFTQEGFNVLGNLIESNPDSPNSRFYGPIQIFARHLLGYSYQPLDSNKISPSALEHFETSLRDPIFYQLYKKIVLKFQKLKYFLPPYTKQELSFPGVKILNFGVDRLVTFFDYFYSDISNVVYDTPEELVHDTFHIRTRQYRLNNKPFTYKLNVKSEKDTKAVVKMFLGPKYDEYGRQIKLFENRLNMVILDYFVYDLKSGENVITRNSYDFEFFGSDITSYADLYKDVMGAYNGQQEFRYNKQNYFYYPRRYMLPKGSDNGLPYQFYVIVYPYVPKQGAENPLHESYYYPYVGSDQFIDNYPLGWPFDRFIKFEQMWYQIPNSYFYEAKIYHKKLEEINLTVNSGED